MIREQRLAEAFVELADSLVDDFDVVDLMVLLTERSIEILGADAAGLLLADSVGALHLVAATSDASETVELFQVQNDEGPCRDCYRTGVPVSTDDLAKDIQRWPGFAPVAIVAGLRAVHAFPLRLRGQILGAMNLFQTEPVALSGPDVAAAQALADVATIALVQSRALHESNLAAEQLQEALNSRIVIEQAKGILAQRHGCGMEEAFRNLRLFARTNSRRLSEVAEEVVSGALRPDEIGVPTQSSG